MALCKSVTPLQINKTLIRFEIKKLIRHQISKKKQLTKRIERGNMESMTEINENMAVEKSEAGEAPKQFVAMKILSNAESAMTKAAIAAGRRINRLRSFDLVAKVEDERGDVPGWVLVVLMTTGLVTAIWTIAAPRLTTILKSSLDAMNGIR